MKSLLILSLFALASAGSVARAENTYICANENGDTVRIELSGEGKRMSLRSRYVRVSFIQDKNYAGLNPGYSYFQGRYPSGNGYGSAIVAVQSRLIRGSAKGSITLDGEDYACRAGAGKLKVSRQTKEELNPSVNGGEPCRLTSYYAGMVIMPPRIMCDYGNGTIIWGK